MAYSKARALLTTLILTCGGGLLLLVGLLVYEVNVPGPWQKVPFHIPEADLDLIYLRQSMPNFVGTEQIRRLYILGWDTVDLPVQMGGRDPVNVYLSEDSKGVMLRFDEFQGTTNVSLGNLETFESRVTADSMGKYIGAFVSPNIWDLRFIPADEGRPVELDP